MTDETEPASPAADAEKPKAKAAASAPVPPTQDLPEGVSEHVVEIDDEGNGTIDLPLFESGIRAVTDQEDRPIAASTSTPAPGITRVVLSSLPKGDVVLRIVSNPTASH